MKKIIIFLLISVGTTTVLFAQQNKFDIGIEGGPSRTFLRGNDFLEEFYDPKIGFSGGIFLQYNFPKIFSIRTNLAFERKGTLFKGTLINTNGEGYGEFTAHLNYEYLTLPVLIRAGFGNKVKYFVNAGPFLGHLMKQENIVKAAGYLTLTNEYTNSYKQFDVGITAGLGVTIPIKEKFYISCEIRNNQGLLDISKSQIYNGGTIKTNSTNLLVGLAYKLGTR